MNMRMSIGAINVVAMLNTTIAVISSGPNILAVDYIKTNGLSSASRASAKVQRVQVVKAPEAKYQPPETRRPPRHPLGCEEENASTSNLLPPTHQLGTQSSPSFGERLYPKLE